MGTLPFIIASKNYVGISPTKWVKILYNENLKSLKKGIGEDTRNKKTSYPPGVSGLIL